VSSGHRQPLPGNAIQAASLWSEVEAGKRVYDDWGDEVGFEGALPPRENYGSDNRFVQNLKLRFKNLNNNPIRYNNIYLILL
jgi:hypothetical protein